MFKRLILKLIGPWKYDRVLHEKIEAMADEIALLKLRMNNQVAPERGEEAVDDVLTLKDISRIVETSIINEDPGLQGKLSMMMHVLADPNSGYSLYSLATQISSGAMSDKNSATTIAQVLELMVASYREEMTPWDNFHTSDADCLMNMDKVRGTCHS